jgi:predicted dehydrogenase
VAVCDPARAKAEARAQEFGIARVYTDFAEMLDQEKPDAVDIATPVATHAPLTLMAARRGVHVMLQKPKTPTLAKAEPLVREVGEKVRFMRATRHFRSTALRSSALAEPSCMTLTDSTG